MKKINIKELASKLKLSVSSVSRGLNNHNNISSKTKKRILTAAKKYNYSEGDFPKCESAGKSVISFPVHEFITKEHLDKIVYHVKSFYES